jgi:hypothetical protein
LEKRRQQLLFGIRSLEYLALPAAIEIIGGSAFFGCQRLNRIVFPRDCRLKTIEDSAFSRTAIPALDIPDTVTTIGASAFAHCPALVSISFGAESALTSIGSSAFAETSIAYFKCPDNTSHIGDRVFANSKLRGIRLSPKIDRLPPFAFFGCTNLDRIVICTDTRFEFMPESLDKTSASLTVHASPEVSFVGVPQSVKIDQTTIPSTLEIQPSEYEPCAHPHTNLDALALNPDDFELASAGVRSGAYGSVRKMRRKRTGAILACKEIHLTEDPRSVSIFHREIDILAKLAHPAILGFVGHVMPRNIDGYNTGCIYTQWIEHGSLADHNLAELPPTVRAKAAVGIALAMRYMHACGICHRDLKPGNILLDENYEIRVADLGSARFTDVKLTLTANIGTPMYMAPEIAEATRDVRYTEKVDIFSFAILLWEIVMAKRPYAGISVSALTLLIKVMQGLRPDAGPNAHMTPLAEQLIPKCWQKDPQERPDAAEILSTLKEGQYALLDGVDVGEVEQYVCRIEAYERSFPPQREYGQ